MAKARTTAWVAGAAALLVGGSAAAQPMEPIPYPEVPGPQVPAGSSLTMPSDPEEAWLLRPSGIVYSLELDGELTGVGTDEFRVDRGSEAPAALLTIQPQTAWFLEGEAVTVDQIPLGSRVHAVFDLVGNERIARRVDAAPPGSLEAPTPPVAPPVHADLGGVRVPSQEREDWVWPDAPEVPAPLEVRPLPDAPRVPQEAPLVQPVAPPGR